MNYTLNQKYKGDQIKEDATVGHIACTVEIKNYYRIIFRKYEGKRPLERCRHRQDDNTTMALKRNRV